MTKVIGVTGASGFIGTHVVKQARLLGYDVLTFDRLSHQRWRKSSIDNTFFGDIRDGSAVHDFVAHCDGVIHLAGLLGTQETIEHPYPAAETNIMGGLNVLQACSAYDIPLVNIGVGNWFENNTYSLTKNTVERFCLMYRDYRDLPVNVVRALNAYGPGQSVAAPYGPSKVRKIMPSFIMRALSNDPIEIYGDGNQVMDMVYVGDVATILLSALSALMNNAAPCRQVIDAGTGRLTTVNDIAKAVLDAVPDSASEIVHIPMRPGETPGVVVIGDPTTTRQLWPNGPYSFRVLEAALPETVEYFRDHH
jgi:UDP-glucose 4-epimerase